MTIVSIAAGNTCVLRDTVMHRFLQTTVVALVIRTFLGRLGSTRVGHGDVRVAYRSLGRVNKGNAPITGPESAVVLARSAPGTRHPRRLGDTAGQYDEACLRRVAMARF